MTEFNKVKAFDNSIVNRIELCRDFSFTAENKQAIEDKWQTLAKRGYVEQRKFAECLVCGKKFTDNEHGIGTADGSSDSICMQCVTPELVANKSSKLILIEVRR